VRWRRIRKRIDSEKGNVRMEQVLKGGTSLGILDFLKGSGQRGVKPEPVIEKETRNL